MKVVLDKEMDITAEEIKEADEAGEIKEMTDEEFKKHLLSAKQMNLSPQVVEFARKELNLTPDEFVAMLLKQNNATQ